MYPLFESIGVVNGKIQYGNYHENRFRKAYHEFYGELPPYNLLDGIVVPKTYNNGRVKLRISYGRSTKTISFDHYQVRPHNTLKLVTANTIAYPLKLEDREQLNHLYSLRQSCDDVLIARQSHITDSSYANITFFDGKQWWTPSTPLLHGTCRQRLLDAGTIQERVITIADLDRYQGFQLINALLEFNPKYYTPIAQIFR
ncbi:MAG: aminotransferase class IV [Bacteroidota bacterium]